MPCEGEPVALPGGGSMPNQGQADFVVQHEPLKGGANALCILLDKSSGDEGVDWPREVHAHVAPKPPG